MGHVVRDTSWGLIDINTNTGQILFQQRWKYFWLEMYGAPNWTLAEKKKFHARSEVVITNAWNGKVKLQTHGTAPFAKKYRAQALTINFDIRWVTAKAHWAVTVKKYPPNPLSEGYSSVSWNERKIVLQQSDVDAIYHKHKTKPYKTRQLVVAHEFGHAIGYSTPNLGGVRGDEYRLDNIHYYDRTSIMHTGMQTRPRHFKPIVKEMNKMIPDCHFSVLGG